MTMAVKGRVQVVDMIVVIRCTGLRKSGHLCDHIVIRLPLSLWEQAIADEIEPECASCHTIAKLVEWR